ncbi:MAG: RHS repeat-associated core domain-containing protein [Chitinophagia bacterium]
MRVIQPIAESNGLDAIQIAGSLALPNNKQGVFDYFIRDFQSNVRMILTDENHFSSGTATMEQERASREEPYFGQPNGANELAQTRFPVNQIPGQLSGSGWQNSGIGNYVSKLGNLAAGKVGPNSLLKVMAGDEISASTQYYFKTDLSNTGSSNITENIVSSLLAALTGGGASILSQKGNISSQLMQNGSFGSFVQPIEGNLGNSPRAYLSVLFFDERFNFIPEGSGQLRATDAENSNANLSLLNLKAPKNGYAYIYVSNSSDVNVYFDNVKIAHTRGRIVEENHYYAFGLRIAAISSKKLPDQTGNEGNTTNSYLYNDKELFEDGDLGWYDYGFRNYDVQIGRFPQLDPLTDEYHFLTPYQYASDDPISNIDLDGLEGVSSTGLQEVVVQSTIKHATAQVAKTTVGSITANFAKGLVESGINTLVGALNVVIHPIETTKQVGSLIDKSSTFEGRLMLGLNLSISALNTYNNFKSGNADVKANIAGNLVGDIAQLFIGTEELKAASYALEASNFERQMLKFAQNAEKAELGAAKRGGRLGNSATRNQIGDIASTLESRGYTITGGGGRRAEEFLKPLGGGRKGGSFLDITATHPNYPTLRINTVDTYKSGLPTFRESLNAARIRKQIAPGEHLLLIPKK